LQLIEVRAMALASIGERELAEARAMSSRRS